MTLITRTVLAAIIISGSFCSACFISVAWSASPIQIHAPTIRTPTIRTPTIHTPTVVHTTKVNTPSTTGSHFSNTIRTRTSNTEPNSTSNNSSSPPSYSPNGRAECADCNSNAPSWPTPQGISYPPSSAAGGPTVTIDGRTMPLNGAADAYIKQLEGAHQPLMWVGNQLVPVNAANIEKAEALESQVIEKHDGGDRPPSGRIIGP
jgi:hypothetical protein